MNHPTTERLLNATKDIWEGYHAHPFVQGIGDGSLDKEKFRFYIIQDYLYLIDYSKVFSIGAAKASDLNTMTLFSNYVSQILNGEMDIHDGYMGLFHVTEEEMAHTAPALDNLSYTSYMLRIAYEGGPAETAASILSCALSYEVIAKRLLENNPSAASHPFYGSWISGYASEAYHEENQALITLVEELTRDYSEEQLAHLEEIFVACSRYEAAFWQMAWEMRS